MKMKKLLISVLATVAVVSATAMMASAASASLLSNDVSKWKLGEVTFNGTTDKATITAANGVLKFGNKSGLWPSSSYTFDNAITANVANDKITYDLTPGKQASIIIFFNESTPDGDASKFAILNQKITGAKLDEGSGDILASTTALKGQIALADLKIGEYDTKAKAFNGAKLSTLADDKGNVKITAVRVFASGTGTGTLDIRDLSFAKAGDATIETTPNTASNNTPNNAPTEKKASSNPSTGEPMTATALLFGLSVLSCGALLASKKVK